MTSLGMIMQLEDVIFSDVFLLLIVCLPVASCARRFVNEGRIKSDLKLLLNLVHIPEMCKSLYYVCTVCFC